jgi:hypothetical protein
MSGKEKMLIENPELLRSRNAAAIPQRCRRGGDDSATNGGEQQRCAN